jgi:uncharacterized membrane protein
MKRYYWMLIVLLALAPLAYMGMVYERLPAQVGLHFDINDKPDRMGPKAEGWWPLIALSTVMVLITLLFNNLHRFDPKQKGQPVRPVYKKLALTVALLLCFISFMIVLSMKNSGFGLVTWLYSGLSLLFAAMGNLMPQLKPNYFAGFRTPWALNDADNWRYTHQLAGKWWFGGGLLAAIACLLAPVNMSFVIFMSVVAVITIVPFIKSYQFFKNRQKTS